MMSDLSDRPAKFFSRLQALAEPLDGLDLIKLARDEIGSSNLALVSSFGAEAAVLLALVAEIDPAIAVIFLETHKHFPETIEYRDQLVARLGLTNLVVVEPEPSQVTATDPNGILWRTSVDGCCAIRKVAPLAKALQPYRAWFNGRKRYQAETRAAIPKVELDGSRLKFNPLAEWDRARIAAEFTRRSLPHHPLVPYGYLSIGCAPCTTAVEPGSDPRAGRWATPQGQNLKIECGIHI
ncbi:MAG: phosphoadenylyl-sulfate reductase [Candidatus Pacebacteria bacterium]|nr:phosphoadenylyl-sulfate reductase [Candidatus Paceibacterota bacterium]